MKFNFSWIVKYDSVKLLTAAVFGVGLSLVIPDLSLVMRMKTIDYTSTVLTDAEKIEMNGCDVYYATVSASDLDLNNHVNNAKFVRDLNFTRRRFFVRWGIQRLLNEEKKTMVIQAQTIRYRKELKWGDEYTIRTEIIAVSDFDRSFFLCSKFCDSDNFVLAIHHCKYRIIAADKGRSENANEGMSPTEILSRVGLGHTLPLMYAEICHFWTLGTMPIP